MRAARLKTRLRPPKGFRSDVHATAISSESRMHLRSKRAAASALLIDATARAATKLIYFFRNQVDLAFAGFDFELDLIAEDVAAIDHAERIAFFLDDNHEEEVLAIDMTVLERQDAELVGQGPGQLIAIHLEHEGVFDPAAGGLDISFIGTGIVGGESGQGGEKQNGHVTHVRSSLRYTAYARPFRNVCVCFWGLLSLQICPSALRRTRRFLTGT